MLYCVVANCSSTTNRRNIGYNPYVEFLSFPKNKSIREKWIERCCQKYRFDASSSKICSLHFRPTDFSDKTRLHEGIIPTENLPKKFENFDNINNAEDATIRENVDPLLLPTMEDFEENVHLQEEMNQKPDIADDSLWKECIETQVDIDVKEEPKNDLHIGLEMDVEEENEPTNEQQMIKHQELYITTQSPPVIEQSSFKEDNFQKAIADRLHVIKPTVRESPSFKSPISVRDISTLTKKIPAIAQSKPPTVPLKLREVPRSEALLAVLKKQSTFVRAPPSNIKQYPVKKPPSKLVKTSTDGTLLTSYLLKDKLPNQNVEDSGGSIPNQTRKRIRVISVNQANRENRNVPPLITLPCTSNAEKQRQNEGPSDNVQVVDLDETDLQSKQNPHKVGLGITMSKNSDKMSIGDNVRKSETIYLKCKSSSLELICVLCARYTSPTYNIQPMATFIKEIVNVNISNLTLPLRACAQCIWDTNVALRLRYRVRAAYKKLVKNKNICSQGIIDDPVPVQISPEKVLRTYGKSNNLKRTSETKSIENMSAVENSTSYSQRELTPYEQNEKENHLNKELTSYKNNSQSKFIDIELINDDNNKEKENERNKIDKPNFTIKSIINKESQIEQERENNIVEIRESQLKNSQVMKINEKRYKPSLQEIIDSEKEDSDDDLSFSRKRKICFCRSNIPRDVFQLPDAQLRREFAKEKYITSRCLRCFQWFPSAKRLKRHIRKRCSLYAIGPEKNFVDGIETRTCDLCQCVFRSHIDVLIHKDGIHNNNNCPDCLMRFKDSVHAAKHKDIHKTDDVTMCLYCARLVSTRGYRVHRITHGWDWWTWRRRRCNKCNGEVVKKETYTCIVCKMNFRTPAALKKHSWTHRKRDFICTVCTKVFLTRPILKQHLRTHTEKDRMINHNVQHDGIQSNTKPHKCEICNASFLRIATKKKHINESHTEMQEQTNIQLVETVKSIRNALKCEICNITFINSKVKSRHMTIRHN